MSFTGAHTIGRPSILYKNLAKNTIVTPFRVVKVTTVSLLKSDPRRASKINHGSREATVTTTE